MESYKNAKAVTPSDSQGLGFVARGFSVGTSAPITVDTLGGNTNVTIACGSNAGIYNLAITKVYATGTTATGITVYW